MLALIMSMTLWGTLGIFVLWSKLSALDVAFYRCLIGVIFIGAWLVKSNKRIHFNKKTSIITLAGIFLVLNWVLLFKSFQVSTITIGNISYYLQPVMLIILGIFIYKEHVNIQQWILICMSLSGVLLTIDIENLHSPNILTGVTYALIAAFFYSLLTVMMKRVNLDYFKVIFIQLFVGMIMLFPFVHFHQLSITAICCIGTIGVVHTILAYYLYYEAIKTASFTQIAVISYLDPIVAIATDMVFFDRQLNLYQMAGVGLTFAALYCLVTYRPKLSVA